MKKEFYINNRKNFIESIKDNSLVVLHSGIEFQQSADENFSFEVNKNFYYLTGINQANVILMMIKGINGVSEYLFIEENDPVQVKWVGAKLYRNEASLISGIDEKNVKYMTSFKDSLNFALNPSRKNYDEINNLYLDLERRNDLLYKNWVFTFKSDFLDSYPEIRVEDAYKAIVKLRSVKVNDEVEEIKKSIETTKIGLDAIMDNLKPGLYEYQAETYFDSAIKWNGQKDFSFKTIAAAGKNATILHYTQNNTKINDNELVLFDLGCRTNFYISDITRTYPANGKFTERQKAVYNEVLNCNKKCIEFLKPGITWGEYNDYANNLLIKSCKKLGLIKKDDELINYYWHSIGHSIGLDTHDPSIRNMKFVPGMLTTVEPGLYIEEEGIGIRIEDDCLITKDGCINLSKDIIKEVDDIEKYMNK